MKSSNNQSATPLKSRRADLQLIVILCLVVSVGRFSMDSYLPSLPAITTLFKTIPEQVQLTLTCYFLGYGISQFFYGPLSEKYGRRNILLVGMLIFLIGSYFCATASSINILIFGRFLAGIGAGASGVLARAIVTDWFPSESVAIAWAHVTTAIVISLIIGPIVGAIVQQHLGFRYNFWLSIIYGLCVLVILTRWLPETHLNRQKESIHIKKIIYSYLNILQDAKFIIYITCSTLAFSALAIYFQLSPFIFINQFGYNPISYGLVLLWIAFSYIFGGQIIRIYSKNINPHSMINYGAALIFISSLILVSWNTVNLISGSISVFFASFIFVVGARIIIPTGLGAGLKLYRNIAGYASALSGGGQMLGSTLVSYLVAQIFGGTSLYRLAFTLLFLSITISLLLLSIKIKMKDSEF